MNKEGYGHNIKISRWYNNLDEERKDCRANYDGLKYVQLCNILGLKPEDKVLFEHGLAEQMILKANKGKFF